MLPFSSFTSVIGFVLLLGIFVQLLSGFFLSWYYLPEPGLVIELREEMFESTRYGVETFSIHVRGVDVIFTYSYFHIFKKFSLKNYVTTDGDGWILGGYAFFWFHYIVGLGICLSASHLSDLTLTIAANIFWSLINNIHKTYYCIFTNKHMNNDSMLRLMLLHYFTPWYYLYLINLHSLFCHEGWDSDSEKGIFEDKSTVWISWFYDGMIKEFQDSWHLLIWGFCFFFFHHYDINSTAYFFFERWNISELNDIRYYGVAPHWYFKPLMGVLVVAPSHYEGLMWMGLFFVLLAAAPVLYNLYNSPHKNIAVLPLQDSIIQSFGFTFFLLSVFTTASVLPCGRYYYDPEGGYTGNAWIKFAYQYIYLYLGWILYHLDFVDQYIYKTACCFFGSAEFYLESCGIRWNRVDAPYQRSYYSYEKQRYVHIDFRDLWMRS